jgi:archaellin
VFNTSVVKNAGGSNTVLDDPDDRFSIDFDLDDNDPNGLSELEEGDEVIIKINTASGATTSIRFVVPDSLGQKAAIEL